MDTEFPVNVSQVTRVVDEAEVFVVGFMLFPERLLVDARATPDEGPIVKIVPTVSSLDERYQWMRENRPNFPLPERLIFFVWPRSVSALERLSIWARILDRLESLGSGVGQDCARALLELQRLERAQAVAAVAGDGYGAIWERSTE
ncbi:MAG: hypothetical protein Q7R39_06860 [Dehalococcoidia bacterium]|nr:hypothetical protein [Dehalococcoidia bacterium]